MSPENNNPSNPVRPFDWRIWLLGIFLILMVIGSLYCMSALMTADTTEWADPNATLAACKAESVAASSPTPNAADTDTANTNTATNVAGTPTPATPTPTNTNTDNAVAANANRGNTGATDTGARSTPTPERTSTPANTTTNTNARNTNANANTDNRRTETTVPRVVRVDGFGFFGKNGCLTGDAYVFLIVFFAGMLGAAIRAIFSFFVHLGRKDFGFNWVWFYIMLPLFGGTLAITLYFVIRGGFYSGSVGKDLAINVFSFAALGALAGLFSDQTMAKLKAVAESILTKTEPKTNVPIVAKVVIEPANLTLKGSGTSQKLKVTAKDAANKPIGGLQNDNFDWISSDKSVATVDENGVVTNVKPGDCKITAVAKSNAVASNECGVKCE